MSQRPAEARRLSFGQVAELYDRVRPSYPPELVDGVLAFARLHDGEAVVEVGAGTGKATRSFAERGHRIVALEPSAEMAAVARRVLSPYPAVEIVETDFESWHPPPAAFGLLISGQAWHWTDPATRYGQARAALRPGGALAAFWNENHWDPTPVRSELDDAYREVFPEGRFPSPMHDSGGLDAALAQWRAEIASAAGFRDPQVRDYPWVCRYSTAEYLRLISTHSDHVVLEPSTREHLLGRVAEVLDRHGGAVDLAYVSRLYLARAV